MLNDKTIMLSLVEYAYVLVGSLSGDILWDFTILSQNNFEKIVNLP